MPSALKAKDHGVRADRVIGDAAGDHLISSPVLRFAGRHCGCDRCGGARVLHLDENTDQALWARVLNFSGECLTEFVTNRGAENGYRAGPKRFDEFHRVNENDLNARIRTCPAGCWTIGLAI